jgi:hypothetical protein
MGFKGVDPNVCKLLYPSFDSEEDVENVKVYRQTTDSRRSQKVTGAFSSSKLKTSLSIRKHN